MTEPLQFERRHTRWDVVFGVLSVVVGIIALGHVAIAGAISVLFLGWTTCSVGSPWRAAPSSAGKTPDVVGTFRSLPCCCCSGSGSSATELNSIVRSWYLTGALELEGACDPADVLTVAPAMVQTRRHASDPLCRRVLAPTTAAETTTPSTRGQRSLADGIELADAPERQRP